MNRIYTGMGDFPVPIDSFISRLNELARSTHSGVADFTVDTVRMFFERGGVLSVEKDENSKVIGMASVVFSDSLDGCDAVIELVAFDSAYGDGYEPRIKLIQALLPLITMRGANRIWKRRCRAAGGCWEKHLFSECPGENVYKVEVNLKQKSSE